MKASILKVGLVGVVAMSTGCGLHWTVKAQCPAGGSSRDCTISGEVSNKSGGSLSMAGFDAANLSASVAGGNAQLFGATGTVSLTLRNASNGIVGAKSFGWTRYGTELAFTNPSSVNSWISGFSGVYAIDVDWGKLTAVSQNGSNSFVFEVVYDGVVEGGDAYAWYYNPNGSNPPTHQQ